jgi:glycogen(starch) synthase
MSGAGDRKLSKGFVSTKLGDSSGASSAAAAASAVDEDRPSMDMSTNRVDRGMDQGGAGPLLLEVSNEVCRKSGGIYTVLQSKVPVTKAQWDNRYALIGVYDPPAAAYEFEALEPSKLSGAALAGLKAKYGVEVRYGRWLVDGYPRVFLIDVNSCRHKVDEWRHDLMPGWGAPHDAEVNDALSFGYQTALLLRALLESQPGRQFIAHFHEWNSAVGLIVARKWQLPLATVFTTHATLIGRYLCAGHVDLYRNLLSFNGDIEASKRQIYHRHWIEKEAAQQAHVFTTVSDITALEAEQLLGRRADVILPNGLVVKQHEALHEFQNLHQQAKLKLHQFVRGHFYGHYDFDLDKTLYVFTSGRREYYNKGVDLFLEAMARLNGMMKASGSDMTVVAFIIMPGQANQFNVETLKGQSVMRELRATCDKIVDDIGQGLFENLARGNMPDPAKFLSSSHIVEMKHRLLYIQKREGLPPICTHNVVNDADDEILCALRRLHLFNDHHDRVKVVYHPEFVNATSPVLPFSYTEFVRACHFGIFPSYYEPWGYTPAECAVLGVPSITSNLAGFGSYIEKNLQTPHKHGIHIIDRISQSWEAAAQQIADVLSDFSHMSRRERIELRNRVERLSAFLDWKALGKHYFTARSLALERVHNVQLQPSESYGDLSVLDQF